MEDTDSQDRGVRQASAKLLLHLADRCHHIQKELATMFASRIILTDVFCHGGQVPSAAGGGGGRAAGSTGATGAAGAAGAAGVASRGSTKGGYLCLLACGEKLQHHKSMMMQLQQAVPKAEALEEDHTALGTSIVTALLLGAEGNTVEEVERGCAVTLPRTEWEVEPVDPCTHVLAFVDYGSQMQNDDAAQITTAAAAASRRPNWVVEKHMHRWKDHVSRSLLTQM